MRRVPLLAALLALAMACRDSGAAAVATTAAQAPGATPAARPSPLVEQPREGRIVVKAADGSRALEIEHKGRTVEIVFLDGGTSRTLRGEEKDTGKRKYAAPGAAIDVEVRPEAAGFKVRTPSGALLWKVKLDDDKIKVSDNEENRNAWSIKTKYADKVKVVNASDAEVGQVRFYRDRQKVKVEDAAGAELFESSTTRDSAAFGVLLMRHVPAGHRAIIMAEILARGR
jgi:hypothetical protein